MTHTVQKVLTLREIALAVQAFDRSLSECAMAVVGRPFNDKEVKALLQIVRSKDPRDIGESDLNTFNNETRR